MDDRLLNRQHQHDAAWLQSNRQHGPNRGSSRLFLQPLPSTLWHSIEENNLLAPLTMDFMSTATTTASNTLTLQGMSSSPFYIATTTSKAFEPVLSVPSLLVFVVIGTMFAALQWRVTAIEAAVDSRTRALQRLRHLSAASLSDPTIAREAVDAALTDYERAYKRVETLRTVGPGLRVVPPTTPTSRRVRLENEAAARQFLGIASTTESSRSNESLTSSNDTDESDGKLASPILISVLILVGLSQIALLTLLTLSDPMASLSDGTIMDVFTGGLE
jgi:hypothetical protein